MGERLGPVALGRGIVVGSGGTAPSEAGEWPWLEVDDAAIKDPAGMVTEMHRLWQHREPFVVELIGDPQALREPEVCKLPVYSVDPAHEFWRERLQYLVWSNNYDGRDDSSPPIWWHSRRALRLGAAPGDCSDVVLPDGSPAWCDGGPRGPITGLEGTVVVHRETIETGSLRADSLGRSESDLAPDQRVAVEHGAGPARIIAPAGSGKTRVLTDRLRHLIQDRRVTPSSVLAVAFNKRAADELVERTQGLQVHVRTLNSLGLAIVNGTGPFASTGEGRRVIDEREMRSILEALVTVRRQVNTDPWVPYLDALSAIRLGLMSPAVAEETFPDAAGIGEIFDRYREKLIEQRAVDFDEQIYLAIELLLTRPDLRKVAQVVARHLLVDEFQDLTPAHLLMLRLLAAPTFDVFGVGDDDQVIYSYAGASPKFLINYRDYFPDAALYALETNYRCPPEVVQGATNLLAFNQIRVAKTILPRSGRQPSDTALVFKTVPAEMTTAVVAAKILDLVGEGTSPADIAVLTRVNSALMPIQVTLYQQGIPATMPIGKEILQRTGIRTALAYLRIGSDLNHISRSDVAETLRRPSRKIARNVADMLQRDAHTSIVKLRRLANGLTGGDGDKVLSYAADIELVAKAVRTESTTAVLKLIGEEVGLGSAMDTLDSSRRDVDRSSHHDDLDALAQVAHLHADPSSFEEFLAGVLTSPLRVGELVTLATVHKVKGQEWPYVFVLGADADLFPHRLASDVEEERRVFHVAITRASAAAVVVADIADPSPFCQEMLGLVKPSDMRARVQHRSGVTRQSSVSELPAAWQAFAGRERPRRQSTFVGAPPTPERFIDEPAREALSKALRDWRKETSARDKVPAYIVLSDADLEGIATVKPASIAALARCRGIGPMKLEKYGDDILAAIEAAAPPAPAPAE